MSKHFAGVTVTDTESSLKKLQQEIPSTEMAEKETKGRPESVSNSAWHSEAPMGVGDVGARASRER